MGADLSTSDAATKVTRLRQPIDCELPLEASMEHSWLEGRLIGVVVLALLWRGIVSMAELPSTGAPSIASELDEVDGVPVGEALEERRSTERLGAAPHIPSGLGSAVAWLWTGGPLDSDGEVDAVGDSLREKEQPRGEAGTKGKWENPDNARRGLAGGALRTGDDGCSCGCGECLPPDTRRSTSSNRSGTS